MVNDLQLKKLKEGPKAWNEWRARQSGDLVVNLNGVDIQNINLSGANLHNVNLSGANLVRADLSGANFVGANLNNSKLCGANLIIANLTVTNLSYSNLSYANLSYANLSRANMRGVELHYAKLKETVFGNLDLTEVIGLEEINHVGPSTLDHRTIELSRVLPVNFLRGCGLPDSMIDYLPSMLNEAISFYSCFISYSHEDKVFAQRLHDQLQGQGIRCWLDDHQILPGDDIYEVVDQGIKLWDKVLLCASENSLSSWWVDNEIDATFHKEQQLMNQRKEKVLSLIPLNLDGHMFSGKWKNGKAGQVKSRLAADFTGWETNNDIFEKAFEKVVKALKTDDGGREIPPKSLL